MHTDAAQTGKSWHNKTATPNNRRVGTISNPTLLQNYFIFPALLKKHAPALSLILWPFVVTYLANFCFCFSFVRRVKSRRRDRSTEQRSPSGQRQQSVHWTVSGPFLFLKLYSWVIKHRFCFESGVSERGWDSGIAFKTFVSCFNSSRWSTQSGPNARPCI